MRRLGRPRRTAVRRVHYDHIVRESIDAALVKPPALSPAVIVPIRAEDRREDRDALQIARAASTALRSAVA